MNYSYYCAYVSKKYVHFRLPINEIEEEKNFKNPRNLRSIINNGRFVVYLLIDLFETKNNNRKANVGKHSQRSRC